MQFPDKNKIPEKGFYYHYKHDPSKGVTDYAYEMAGVGVHTEEDCRPEDANMIVYRPLYQDASVFKAGKLFDLRPFEMWVGDVIKDGRPPVKRFQKINDPEVIKALEIIKIEMYGSN
jgi:hypothetical protein